MILSDEFLFESLFIDFDFSLQEQTERMLEELYLIDVEGFELEESLKYIEGSLILLDEEFLEEAIRPKQMLQNAKDKLATMWEKILEWIQTMVAKIAVFVNKFTESKQRIADLDLTFKKVMAGKKDKLDTFLSTRGYQNKAYIQDTAKLVDDAVGVLQGLTNLTGDSDASMKMAGKDSLGTGQVDKNTRASGWVVMENKLLEILNELSSRKKVVADEDMIDFTVTPAVSHNLLILKSKKLHGMMTTIYKNYKNRTHKVERLGQGDTGPQNSKGNATYNNEGLKHAKGAISLSVRIFALMISIFSNHMTKCTEFISYTNTKMASDKNFKKTGKPTKK